MNARVIGVGAAAFALLFVGTRGTSPVEAKDRKVDSGWEMSGAFMKRSFALGDVSGYPTFSFFQSANPPALYPAAQFDGYLLKLATGNLSGVLTMTAQITVSGAPVFEYNSEAANTCVSPATARPYFQSGNNDLQRWWANSTQVVSAIVLQSGTYSVSIPLQPAYWSSVYGENGADHQVDFQASLNQAYQVGMTFGGGCFFGHGVNVYGGSATFSILNYAIH